MVNLPAYAERHMRCSRCGAEPTHPCRTPKGRTLKSPHREREGAYVERHGFPGEPGEEVVTSLSWREIIEAHTNGFMGSNPPPQDDDGSIEPS